MVEIDGDSHFTAEAQVYDLQRTSFFNSLGIRVIRFLNVEVGENLEGVLWEIGRNLRE